jgi:hypothetical protein
MTATARRQRPAEEEGRQHGSEGASDHRATVGRAPRPAGGAPAPYPTGTWTVVTFPLPLMAVNPMR